MQPFEEAPPPPMPAPPEVQGWQRLHIASPILNSITTALRFWPFLLVAVFQEGGAALGFVLAAGVGVALAIEIARYVIPVAAFTSMVHTVSGIVLHRLHRMMLTGDAKEVAGWVAEELALDFSSAKVVPEVPRHALDLPRLAVDGEHLVHGAHVEPAAAGLFARADARGGLDRPELHQRLDIFDRGAARLQAGDQRRIGHPVFLQSDGLVGDRKIVVDRLQQFSPGIGLGNPERRIDTDFAHGGGRLWSATNRRDVRK